MEKVSITSVVRKIVRERPTAGAAVVFELVVARLRDHGFAGPVNPATIDRLARRHRGPAGTPSGRTTIRGGKRGPDNTERSKI